ncbi:MAG: efflux RND transporter periplasmic adaptor subunit [Verrucomicrobiota bacterium JB023]|nr:efflux RND transporter periplasmic adaptor subunit [Verrucomicrobiota bacterium JB023]
MTTFITPFQLHYLTTMKDDTDKDLANIIQSAHHSRTKGRLLTALIILALGAGGYFWFQSQQTKQTAGPNFITTPVKQGDVSLTIITTGTLEPTNQVTIGTEVSGTVEEVYVDINDHVTEGQALAKLDTTKLSQTAAKSRAAVRSAMASVTQAKASLKENQADLTRLQQLHEISGGRTPSQADLDAAIATVDRAQADLETAYAAVAEAEAQLKSDESDLSKAVMHSPVDGVVLSRDVEPGQTVAAQFTAPELFVIAEDLSTMLLTVDIAEADIGRVEPGQNATFTVDAWPKRKFNAVVETVSYGSETTDNVVTYATELDVSNKDLSLRPGMTATATISVAESKDILLVPNTALRFDPATALGQSTPATSEKKSLLESLTPRPPRRSSSGRRERPDGASDQGEGKPQSVFILEDGHPRPIPVETGLTDGRYTEVSSPDLKLGMEVITSAQTSPQP